MAKKVTFFFIIVLILIVGGFFWWQDQENVRELNANLPEGVRVVKSFIGEEYKVVNKIDGYEFAVPEEWEGIKEIEFVSERTESGYTAASIGIEGQEGHSRIFSIDRFIVKNKEIELENWAKDNFNTFGLVGNFKQENVNGIKVVKTQEEVHLLGMWVFFFRNNSSIYTITNSSEELIRHIISNGKW